MKKTTLYLSLFATLCLGACSEPAPPAAAAVAVPEQTKAKLPITAIDPVCEMERDAAWTEYTVYNGDTVKFCSEQCKTAFVARPEKYTK